MGAKSGSKARLAKQNGGKQGKSSEPKEPQNATPDLSVLRKPVEISVPGLSQVVKVLQTGTKEVQHILSCECEIIYECKVCRNLFRSLANLISHKRVYCTQLYSNSHHSTYRKDKGVNDSTVFVQPEDVGDNRKETWVTNDGPGERRGRKKAEEKAKSGPFRITIKKDLTSIVEKLMEKNVSQNLADVVNNASTPSEYYENLEKCLNAKSNEAKEHTIHLEPIDGTSNGIFQTVCTNSTAPKQLMKSQVSDLEQLLTETEAVLGPDGKAVQNGVSTNHPKPPEGGRKKDSSTGNRGKDSSVVTAPESAVELYCNLCKIHFSTYKTLNHHMKSFHMTFRRYYPCPCCKLPLSNSWSVFRHLLKVHRKTSDQIRKLRDQVMKKAYVTEVLQSGAQKLISPVPKATEANQPSPFSADPEAASKLQSQENKAWMDQFEDEYDLQRCGGCGRRFERRAALAAHSQICHKKSQTPGQAHSQAQSNQTPPAPQANKATPTISDKPVKATVRREERAQTPLPPLLPIIHANFSALKENQQRSPIHPTTPQLRHPAFHLENVKNEVPSKKIEIQVRRDYNKGSNMTPEYRARTPSICRSDEGAASSVCKSEDASVNSDNNGESSDASATAPATNTNDAASAKSADVRARTPTPGRKPFASNSASAEAKKVLARIKIRPMERRVGRLDNSKVPNSGNRYPVRHSSSPVVNGGSGLKRRFGSFDPARPARPLSRSPFKKKVGGFSDLTQVKSSDGSEDDVPRSKKRTKQVDSPYTVDSDEDRHRTMETNESLLAAMSNFLTLQCLTCKKKYKTLGNLRRHVAIHLGWFRFRCMVCDFKCFDKCDCVNHVLNNHLESWERHKAKALVADLQLEAGGSHDPLSSESVADSADSEATSSDIIASTSPDKQSCNDSSPCDNVASSDESVGEIRPPSMEVAIVATN